MAEINSLNVVDADNTSRFPENQLPSTVNNGARALEGIIARWDKDTNASLTPGGTADVITLAANQTLAAYYDGMVMAFEASGTNTGAVTINVDAIGAKALKKNVSEDMAAGEILSGQKIIAIYDGTNFQIISPFLDVAIAASEAAAAASAAAALVSENAAAADLVLTNADVVLTHADVVLTGLDVTATNADVVLTTADAVSTAADVISSAANAAAAIVAKIEWQGTYSGATAYVLNDAVTYLGSSYINIQAGTGQTPVVGGTAYWDDLANKGTDGAGDLTAANNLSDVANAATSLTNLGGIGAATTDTLTNKILQDYGEKVNVIGSTGGGTQDIDLTLGNVITATVDTSANTFTFSNPTATGNNCGFILYLTNGGSQTVAWPASVDFPAATAPTLTEAGVDILVFNTTDAGTTWYGNLVGAAYG